MPEEEKCALLEREIVDPRPIIPRVTDRFQPVTQEVIATFLRSGSRSGAVIRRLSAATSSRCRSPSDVLEVLLLMKESDLAEAGGGGAVMPIAPLFESPSSLSGATGIMGRLIRVGPVPRGACLVGRRAGGDDRLLRLEQGDRLSRLNLGAVRGANEI